MAKLGLPYLSIVFQEQGIARIERSKRGVVAMVLYDSEAVAGNYTIYTLNDVPEGLSDTNRDQIRLALMGYVTTPRKIELVVEASETPDAPTFDITSEGFRYLEQVRWDYLTVPFIGDAFASELGTWVKTLNENYQKRCKVVLPNEPMDYHKVINYTTPEVDDGLKVYATNEYTSRITGLIAGTPPQIAATYAPLPELVSCTYYTRDEIAEKIGDGELVLMNDGEKIKVARGVNSLTTTNQILGESFRKIKIVEIMDFMADDIQHTAEDQYLGKYSNSLDHKILLISAIEGYMEVLEKDDLLAKGSSHVEIDIEAQKAFLKSMGYKTIDGRTVDEMEEQEIKEADTKDKVFIKAYCKILDAIEEIELRVQI